MSKYKKMVLKYKKYIGFLILLVLCISISFSYDYFYNYITNNIEVSSLGVSLEPSIFFMNFNKPADGTNIRDNSIYNHAGNVTGATYNSSCGVTSVGNDLGGCYEFDGDGDSISINGISDSILENNAFSISTWIKTGDLDGSTVWEEAKDKDQNFLYISYIDTTDIGLSVTGDKQVDWFKVEDFNEYSPNNNPTRIVNEIYDDFESMTCDNCEYYCTVGNDECLEPEVREMLSAYGEYPATPINGFGCNRFKRKTNE
jgi:hypothetical protein